MSGGLAVAGGSDGIAARTEDLLLAAGVLARLGAEIGTALEQGLPSSCWFDPLSLVLGPDVSEECRRAAAPAGAARTAQGRCAQLQAALVLAARRYAETEHATAARIAWFGLGADPGLWHGVMAVVDGALTATRTGGLGGALQHTFTGDPALAAGAMVASGLLADDVLIASHYPDGSPVVTATGADPAPRPAPRSVSDVLAGLAVRDAASEQGGHIDVTFVTASDGTRRAIVDIPGTKCWTPGASTDVTSLATNARALVGQPTSYAVGVLTAMRRAGVRPDEPVLLAGHSEGGMVAVEVAATAHRTGEFDVTHVVTAGSPIARTVGALPSSVSVLALENTTDVVPELDAAANPDRRNVTTVRFTAGDGTVQGDHALTESYSYGARLVDRSRDRSVRDFERSASGFLGGGRVDTATYTVSRKP